MITDQRAICGGESLAHTVRDLEERAHRLQVQAREGVEPDSGEARELLERIRQTRQTVRGAHQEELRRWLDSLRRQVRESAETCVCA